MTITVDIGKFKAKIEYNASIAIRSREIELNVDWVSCGVYSISYYRPLNAEKPYVIVEPDWYPPNIHIGVTPEQFKKVAELYPCAPKQPRNECYKPFYEDYNLDPGMFDFGHDTLFRAFKDPKEEKVYMVNYGFVQGCPVEQTSVLGLYWEDFQRLKELIESKESEIFYSGCKISM